MPRARGRCTRLLIARLVPQVGTIIMAVGSVTGVNLARTKRAAVKPATDPPFTLSTLRKAIPPHCFERSLVKSFSHLFLDLAVLAVLYYGSTHIDGLQIASNAKWFLWAIYWVLAGSFGTGVWVLAHECGHQVGIA